MERRGQAAVVGLKMLPDRDWHEISPSAYEHERQGLAWIRENLPANEGFVVWSNFTFDGKGKSHEVDCLVASPHGVFIVELKDNCGTLQIDKGDWLFRVNGHKRLLPPNGKNPRIKALDKAKDLKQRLERVVNRRAQLPYIEALAFFTNEGVDISNRIRGDAGLCVRCPSTNGGPPIIDTLQDPSIAALKIAGTPNSVGALQEFAGRMEKIGLYPRDRRRRVGKWELVDQVSSHDGVEDWLGTASDLEAPARVRCYVQPPLATAEQIETLRNRAKRECNVLRRLQHPNVERVLDVIAADEPQASRGPAVIFDGDYSKISLAEFMTDRPPLDSTELARALELMADAVAHCQAGEVVHRNLSPETVFRSRHPADGWKSVEVRHWVSAAKANENITQHLPEFTSTTTAYRAPELRKRPGCSTPSVDVFSLGCIAFFLATGKHPPQRDDGGARVTSRGLDAPDELKPLPVHIRTLIERSTAMAPDARKIVTAKDFLDHLAEGPAPGNSDGPQDTPDPKDDSDHQLGESDDATAADDAIAATCGKRLGSGSAGTAWHCQIGGQTAVLKVANSPKCDSLIDAEANALASIDSPRVVRLVASGSFNGRRAIAIESAGRITLGELLRQQSPLSPAAKLAMVDQLLELAVDLESAGIVHGDLHPDHIGVDAPPHGLDLRAFDFSLGPSKGTVPGSIRYTDPFYDPENDGLSAITDRYSLAAIMHAVLTGAPPAWGDGTADPSLEPTAAFAPPSDLAKTTIEFFESALASETLGRPPSAEALQTAWRLAMRKRQEEMEASRRQRDAEKVTPESTTGLSSPADFVCPLPKHKGRTLGQIVSDSPGYIRWLATEFTFRSQRFKSAFDAFWQTEECQDAMADLETHAVPRPIPLVIGHQDPLYHCQPLCLGAAKRSDIATTPAQSAGFAKHVLIQPPVQGVRHPPAVQNTLHVVEKILLRGNLSPLSPALELLAIDCIEDETDSPGAPVGGDPLRTIPFDSESERTLTQELLIPQLGPERLSCLIGQVNLAALTRQRADETRNERVDFVLADGNDTRIVIEVDGSQHEASADYDADRDRRLTDAGWTVIRVPTEQVRSMTGPKIEEVQAACQACKPERPASIAEDVLSRAAQVHFALLQILRSTPAETECAVEIQWPSWDGVDTAALTSAVIEDFNALTNSVATLYAAATPVVTQASDGRDNIVSFVGTSDPSPLPTWEIRDVHIPGRFRTQRRSAYKDPPRMADEPALRALMERVYGFAEFREGQLEALTRSLLGQDSIVLLPTGAGKTIVFQLTCLLRPGPGLIVSPLIALMDDQLDNLARHGISNAGCLTSTRSVAEREQVLTELGDGELLFTYVAPERFQMDNLRVQLRRLAVQMPVSCVAIDEAHCVSEWGHEFRPSYLNIARNARAICSHQGTDPPLLALTGTASRSVLRDVQRELEIRDPEAVITPTSFERAELEFKVLRCHSSEKSGQLAAVLRATAEKEFNQDLSRFYAQMGKASNCCLIFTPHANGEFGIFKVAEAAQAAIVQPVGAFASKVPDGWDKDKWKVELQKTARAFKANETTVLTATKAFGMGIDKPNIRTTVHYNISSSLESLYQEAGRAGRDRNKSVCWVLLSDEAVQNNPALLEPSTTVEQLAEIERKYGKWQKDDILRQLYFHLQNYKGAEVERERVRSVLNQLSPVDSPHAVTLPYTKDDERKELEKTLHRLLTVGVVADYTIDYSKHVLYAEVLGTTHEGILRTLHRYLSNFDRREARLSDERLRSQAPDCSVHDFAQLAADQLTDFIYLKIEASRRRSLLEVHRACVAGIDDPATFKSIIRDYLQTSKFGQQIDELCEPDELDKARSDLAESNGRAPSDAELAAALSQDAIDLAISCETPIDAGYLRGESARALTDYPDNAQLLLLRAMAECLVPRPRQQAIQEDSAKAITLLASDLDDDLMHDVLASGLTHLLSENSQAGRHFAQAALLSLPNGQAHARRLAARPEPQLRDVGRAWLLRTVRHRINAFLGDDNDQS